ncbi:MULTISPECIES: hypothetical protein [Leptospira]|uniref:hypothetical protein n=1 Tax=Leptospira TaxID=171 RepID=UPI00046C8522|nr:MULTISPECIES: hypothetical protein [Leptospira]
MKMLSKMNSKILQKCRTCFGLPLSQTELITSLREVLHFNFLNKLIALFSRIIVAKPHQKQFIFALKYITCSSKAI